MIDINFASYWYISSKIYVPEKKKKHLKKSKNTKNTKINLQVTLDGI